MISANVAPRRRTPRPVGFASVISAARLHLCAVGEDSEVRRRHIAALLGFTSTVQRSGNRIRFSFEHGPTALWVSEVLGRRDVALVEVGGEGGVVEVFNPQIVLGRYGFREGRWVFGQGMSAALGISRGAVHAAGTFNRRGLKVSCPSAPMMLTLTAVMTRLGINATPTEGEPCAAVSAGDVPTVLDRLGIAGVAEEYQRLRQTDVVRKYA